MSTPADIDKLVREVIRDVLSPDGHDADSLPDETTLASLGADSLDMIDIVSYLEEALDVDLPIEFIEDLDTVGDLISFTKVAVAGDAACAA